MAVRTAWPGTANTGDVVTEALIDELPGGWIGYSIITTGQSSITSITDLTNLSVTVTVGANRLIRVTGVGSMVRSVADGITLGYIREGSTTLGRWGVFDATSANTNSPTQSGSVLLTPSQGSHTYKLSLEQLTGTGSSGIQAGATFPAYILVEDLGDTL